MKKKLFLIKKTPYFIALSLLLSATNHTRAQTQNELANQINNITPKHSQVSVLVQDITSNKNVHTLYKKNTKTYFLPASTMKLFTAVAASSYFTPNFRFQTQLLSDAPIKEGKVEGNLYIVFDGDPTLQQSDLLALFKKLRLQGVNEISGNLYILGNTEHDWQAPGWAWEDLTRCYASPISLYSINQNCIHAELTPNPHLATADLFNNDQAVHIYNSAVFSPSEQECELHLTSLPYNQYYLSGCFSTPEKIKLHIAINSPLQYAQTTLAKIINHTHIQIHGAIINKQINNKKLHVLVSHESKPLHSLLYTLLTESDNFIADSLIRKMGQNNHNKNPFKLGILHLKRELNFLGINLDQATIMDGSGLSRYNLVTAQQLTQVLQLIAFDKRFQYLFNALPVSGIKGTLKKRNGFDDVQVRSFVFAKTGTLSGVDNLAGFIKTHSNKLLLFVSLENGINHTRFKKSNKPDAFNLKLSKILIDL